MGDSTAKIAALVATATSGDSEEAWSAVRSLHEVGTQEVFEHAARLSQLPETLSQVRAADIAARLDFPMEGFGLVMGLLSDTDAAPEVLTAAATALGHLHPHLGQAERSVAAATLVELAAHPEADTRFGVVQGLAGLQDAQAIAALVVLSADPDDDVRNWATFALGTLCELDAPSVREALAARLEDPVLEVRGEAMVGLARRHDDRARIAVHKAKAAGEEDDLVNKAAGLLGE